MSLGLSTEQQHRYLTDPVFHARVFVVARALWEAVARFDLGHERPFPYDRLADVTRNDLNVYAIAAVEALEKLEPQYTGKPPVRNEFSKPKTENASKP